VHMDPCMPMSAHAHTHTHTHTQFSDATKYVPALNPSSSSGN